MKKSYISIFAAIFVIMGILVACHENVIDDRLPVEENHYYENVHGLIIFDEDIIQYILEDVVDVPQVVFDSNIPDEAIPPVGSRIYIPVSEKTPYGVLARVVSINEEENVVMGIESLPLDEVFEFLSVDTTLTVIQEFEGVFDADGNPLNFEIIDTADIDLNDTIVSPLQTRASKDFEFDWNWKEECLKFPVKLYEGKSGKDKIEISGTAFVGFHNFDFDIDIANKKLNYVNLDATPYIKLSLSSTVTTESKLELSDRIGQLRFRIIIPTPIGVPVIIPVSTYIYGTCGIKGELSATLGLQYEYNCKCNASFRNGQWNSDVKHGGFDNKSPWTVGEFDVKGEIYSGAKIGLLVGLYSATSGIGFNVIPKFAIGAQAKLSSPDLLKTNPEVYLSLRAGSEVYCVAELFGKKLAKYSLEFPDFILWEANTYLLPNIKDFTAKGSSSSADISWSHDSDYFLSMVGLKTGAGVFESDATTEVNSYKPTPTITKHPTYETYSYDVNATGLNAGETYYAAPFAYWGNYKWYGEKEEFTTEASYHAGFRCANWDYDNIYFDFTISQGSSNTFDITEEFNDYDGDLERIHFTATYDKETNVLSGVIDYHFYEDPDQRRQDGFSVSLDSDDSGYLYCEKVIANGGCDKMVRITKNGSSKVSSLRANKILINSDCNVGDCL